MSEFCVILAAAGKSSRFEGAEHKKPFADLNGQAVWLHSAQRFLKRADVQQLIIVIAKEDNADFKEKFSTSLTSLNVDVVIGGVERSDSVEHALAKVRGEIPFVAIHDAARPCISDELIDRVFDAAVQHNIAVPTVPVLSTIKHSGDGQFVDRTVDRRDLYLSQTPQAFSRSLLMQMFDHRGDVQPTDEAQLAEAQGHRVAMVNGSRLNIKITTREDLNLASVFLNAQQRIQFDASPGERTENKLWR